MSHLPCPSLFFSLSFCLPHSPSLHHPLSSPSLPCSLPVSLTPSFHFSPFSLSLSPFSLFPPLSLLHSPLPFLPPFLYLPPLLSSLILSPCSSSLPSLPPYLGHFHSSKCSSQCSAILRCYSVGRTKFTKWRDHWI